jgi:accessory gene regulator B
MLERHDMTKKIVDSLIANGTVPSEDRELYEYGIRQGSLMVINVVTSILIGMFLGMILQSIVFILTYIPMRTYAGGYHASTQLRCYLLSIPFMLIALLGIRIIPWNGYICMGTLFLIVLVIYRLAPVENANRPFSKMEFKIFKKRTRIITSVFCFATLLFWVTEMKQIAASIIMALLMISIMLILGLIKNNKTIFIEAEV